VIGIDPLHNTLFQTVSDVAHELGQPVYVVGGYVRDYYLNRLRPEHAPDLDFVTLGSGIVLAEAVAKALKTKQVAVFKQFGTAQVGWKGMHLEFVGARRESYRTESRKPIVEDGTLEDDQRRRDFTINALSWSLNKADYGVLLDPFGGIRDLQNRVIRTPLDPDITFSDDPLRMLRAVRFASQLSFDIDPVTFEGIQAMAKRLDIISKERILDELNKIILSPIPSTGFALLFESGLLATFFPEMVKLHGVQEVENYRHKDNFWHTLQVLDNVAMVSDDLWLRWAAILHDIAKPNTQKFVEGTGWTFHGHDAVGATMTKRIFTRLGLPLDERMRFVQNLVRLHLRPIALVKEEVTESALRRLLFDAGEDLDSLMKLCRADITSKNDRKVQKYLANFAFVEQRLVEVEEKDKLRNWRPPISGEDIMKALNLPPGPEVGKIKKQIEEAILEGDIANERDAAFKYMMEVGSRK
jgi:tRNA nucleotidyltransferase (CCA-adding enzyme)